MIVKKEKCERPSIGPPSCLIDNSTSTAGVESDSRTRESLLKRERLPNALPSASLSVGEPNASPERGDPFSPFTSQDLPRAALPPSDTTSSTCRAMPKLESFGLEHEVIEAEHELARDHPAVTNSDASSSSASSGAPKTAPPQSAWKCRRCNFSCGTRAALRRHRAAHTDDGSTLACPTCGKVVSNDYDLQLHMARVHTETVVPKGCNECDHTYPDEAGAEEASHTHVLLWHSGRRRDCPKCGRKFSSLSLLDKHLRDNHPKEKLLKCSRCDEAFERDSHLLAHFEAAHMPPSSRCTCDQCGETFASPSALKQHKKKKVHMPANQRHTCSRCGKHYGDFGVHVRQFHTEMLFACEWPSCGKRFVGRYELKVHGLTHRKASDRERFPCDKCDKRLLSRQALNKHKQQIHDGVLAFVCPEPACGYKSRSRYDLAPHIASKHRNVKLYECTVCEMVFGMKAALVRHLRNAHKVTVWSIPCIKCGEMFRSRVEVKAHFCEAHRDTPFPRCDKCPETFFTKLHASLHKFVCGVKSCDEHSAQHAGKGTATASTSFSALASTSSSASASASPSVSAPNSATTTCHICDRTLASAYGLRQHISCVHTNHGKRRQFRCPMDGCDTRCETRKHLALHFASQHTTHKFYKCHLCSKAYSTRAVLQKHLKHAHDSSRMQMQCILNCGTMLSTSMELRKHFLAEHANVPFVKCEECSQPFFTEVDRALHKPVCHVKRCNEQDS